MGTVTDLNQARATRETLKRAEKSVSDFASMFSTEARQMRARAILLHWLDENSDLGAEFLVELLAEVSTAAQIYEDLTR